MAYVAYRLRVGSKQMGSALAKGIALLTITRGRSRVEPHPRGNRERNGGGKLVMNNIPCKTCSEFLFGSGSHEMSGMYKTALINFSQTQT
jgi:hypothetical protein